MRARALSILLPIFVLFAVSCENEVELNAPKKDITAAYGILDGRDSLHFVKVNKGFLTKGNAREYAKERYSETYYDNISVTVLEKDGNGTTLRSFSLKDTMVNKEEGVFEHDEPQTLYYFRASDLDSANRYQLRILIDEGGPSEKLVKGSTDLVGNVDITSHNPGSQFGNQLFFYSGGEYREEELEWVRVNNAAELTLNLRFHYRNILGNGDTISRSFDWEVGKVEGSATSTKVGGENFYQRINNELTPNPSGLVEREMSRIDLLVNGMNQELKTYTTVAGPNASIVQDRPDYSNLDTAAIGIFASTRMAHFKGLSLSGSSMDHLIQGNITNDLKFVN